MKQRLLELKKHKEGPDCILALCRVQALNEDLSQIAQVLQAPPKESKNLTSLFFYLLNDRFRTEFEGLLVAPKTIFLRW